MVVAAIKIESFKRVVTMTSHTLEGREVTGVDKAIEIIEVEVEASIEVIEVEVANIATITEETIEEDTAVEEETTTKSIITINNRATLGRVMINGLEEGSSSSKILMSRNSKRRSDENFS